MIFDIRLLYLSIIPPDIDEIISALPSVIETLIIAQFSTFAIIFSAIFIVNQLVNMRYSAEFTDLITRSRQFRITFFSAFSIILAYIVSAVFVPGLNNETVILVALILLILLVIFVYIVYRFVVNILDYLTPSQLLETYSHSLGSDEYIEKSVTAEREQKLELHPLQPVYDTARNTIDRDELSAGKTSNQSLETMCISHAEEIIPHRLVEVEPTLESSGNEGMPTRQNQVHTLFRTPLYQYFPSISQQAGEKNYVQLSREAANSIGEVGRIGYKIGCSELSTLSFEALYKQTMLSVPVEIQPHTNHYPRFVACVDQTMELLEGSIYHEELELYAYLNNEGYEIMRSVEGLLDDEEISSNDNFLRILNSQVKCYEKLVEDHEHVYRREDYAIEDLLGFERFAKFEYYGIEHVDPRVSALIVCRLLFTATVDQYLRSTGGEDSHPSRGRILDLAWQDLLEVATNNPPEASGVLIAQRYIEYLSYFIGSQNGDNKDRILRSSAVDLSLAMENGDFRVFKKAFKEIYKKENRDYDMMNYSGYRGLGRTLIMITLSSNRSSDDFLDIVKKLHIQSMKQFRNRQSRRCSTAVRAYTERRFNGEPLPDPTEFRLKVAEKSGRTFY